MATTTLNSTEDIICKLQELKGKTKLKFYKNTSNLYDEMNLRVFKFEEDLLRKNSQSIIKIYHEVLLLMKFLQTEPQIKNMNNKYYDLYYTVIKNREEDEIVNNKFEGEEVEYVNFCGFITLNQFIGRKKYNVLLW